MTTHCLRGHDIAVVGRDRQHRCLECRRFYDRRTTSDPIRGPRRNATKRAWEARPHQPPNPNGWDNYTWHANLRTRRQRRERIADKSAILEAAINAIRGNDWTTAAALLGITP